MKQKGIDIPDGMKGPLIISAIVHVILLTVAITGLPYFKRPPEPITTAIPIEILPIAETRQVTKPPIEAPPAPDKDVKEKPLEKKIAPPKVDALEPPKLEPPKPKVEDKPKPKPVIPPPPTEKLEKPKPPEEKPKEKPVEQDNTQDFSKLLKNLSDSKPKVDEPLQETKNAEAPAPVAQAAIGEQMTMTDMDALTQQLQNCWSIQAGARYAEDLVVKIRLIVSPDMHATSATVVDQWRYSQDSYFRAAADSAIRAVNSPQCETLKLPEGKYDQWKDMIVTFDPRDML